MRGYIGKVDWLNIEPMKYWAFPASTSDTVKKETVRNAIFSGDYIGALKVDGYYQRLLKDEDGNCFMIARSRNVNGDVIDKYEWVPQIHEWMEKLPNGTCVLAEIFLPSNEGSKNVTSILGCLKDKAIDRQKKTPLHFHVFDVMAFDGNNYNKTHFEERIECLNEMRNLYPFEPYVHYAQYFEGAELWEHLQNYLIEGREGMVIMRKDAIVYEKRTPARVSIKVKKEIKETIDCVVIGANAPTREYTGKSIMTWKYWIHKMTGEKLDEREWFNDYEKGAPYEPVTKNFYYGMAGSLKLGLYKDGQMIYFGDLSGLTEEILTNWENYVGKVVEVGGMQIDDESKHIRHPKFIGWRTDKTPTECTWEQVEKM